MSIWTIVRPEEKKGKLVPVPSIMSRRHVTEGRASHYSRRNPLDRRLFTPEVVLEGTMKKK
jgi:hypothetical protein